MNFATLGSGSFLPPPAPTRGQVYSVPRLSGGYDYYQGPPGTSQPQNDDIPLPVFAHANPIGIAAIAIGCQMPPSAVKIGSGKEARGCVTAMPGAKRPGIDAPMPMGPAMGSYGDIVSATTTTGPDMLANAVLATAGAVAGFLLWRRMRGLHNVRSSPHLRRHAASGPPRQPAVRARRREGNEAPSHLHAEVGRRLLPRRHRLASQVEVYRPLPRRVVLQRQVEEGRRLRRLQAHRRGAAGGLRVRLPRDVAHPRGACGRRREAPERPR